jgi:hypothetical protein
VRYTLHGLAALPLALAAVNRTRRMYPAQTVDPFAFALDRGVVDLIVLAWKTIFFFCCSVATET